MDKKVIEANVPITMYLNDVKDGTINDDQDVQRKFCSDNSFVNGIGITVLTGDYLPPIVLCDVPVGDGVKQTYIADGKQRTAALSEIRFGNYRFTSTTEDGQIEYQTAKKDELGQIVKDGKGNIVWEKKVFDVRGKTFDDFPQELKDRFDKFLVKIATHQNCTIQGVSKYVRRYNNHKPMNSSQKAFTYLDKFGRDVKNIATSGFFKNCIKPSKTEPKNGTYEKMVCEAVMSTFHLDDWKKAPKQMNIYLNENATADEFNRVADNFNSLEFICDDQFQDIFTAKNTFVWMAVFNEFKKLDIEESEFCNFINRFKKYLYDIKVDEYDTSFAELDQKRSPKDKTVATTKLNLLMYLMKDYFKDYIGKDGEETEDVKVDSDVDTADTVDPDILKFVQENVSPDITNDDVSDYFSMLDEYDVDKTSRLLEWQNEPSLVAIIAWSFKNDIDLDDWIKEYFSKNNMYSINQAKNYIHMKKDLEAYLQLQEKQAV